MAVAVREPIRGTLDLETWRCSGCGRIVAKHADLKGTVQIKCKCGTMNTMVVR